ncbi:MAG: hypothetical protein EOP10_30730 [Proteobacteria bacterium]|nr:MAG: hypothetical protein EOP10_30730 [Pseudomonadota bacterium]
MQIITAIENKQLLSLTYKGLHRTVEPHAVGRSSTGNDVLRCYQITGAHTESGHDWNILTVAKIENLALTGQNFMAAQPDYKRGDKGMVTIYAEL